MGANASQTAAFALRVDDPVARFRCATVRFVRRQQERPSEYHPGDSDESPASRRPSGSVGHTANAVCFECAKSEAEADSRRDAPETMARQWSATSVRKPVQ